MDWFDWFLDPTSHCWVEMVIRCNHSQLTAMLGSNGQKGKNHFARSCFDPLTFGLWAQHASPAPPSSYFCCDKDALLQYMIYVIFKQTTQKLKRIFPSECKQNEGNELQCYWLFLIHAWLCVHIAVTSLQTHYIICHVIRHSSTC